MWGANEGSTNLRKSTRERDCKVVIIWLWQGTQFENKSSYPENTLFVKEYAGGELMPLGYTLKYLVDVDVDVDEE